MTKTELVDILKKLNVPISESTPEDDEMEADIRICYWDYYWKDITASNSNYNTEVTYQISVIASIPRHPKLIELKKELNKIGLFPEFQHEYLTEKRRIHSFFSLDVLENIGTEENE